MQRTVSTFMIFPPVDLNSDVCKRAVYLTDHLAAEFPGYSFEVVDLRRIKPVSAREPVTIGDGLSFAVLPLLGTTSNNDGNGGYMAEHPPQSLIENITEFCRAFDFEKARRRAA